jgi:hypothetical protein
MRGDQIELRAGAGIVADSVPERELEETRAKALGMLRAFEPHMSNALGTWVDGVEGNAVPADDRGLQYGDWRLRDHPRAPWRAAFSSRCTWSACGVGSPGSASSLLAANELAGGNRARHGAGAATGHPEGHRHRAAPRAAVMLRRPQVARRIVSLWPTTPAARRRHRQWCDPPPRGDCACRSRRHSPGSNISTGSRTCWRREAPADAGFER